MPTYNKLVRDAIPDIIRQTGKNCRTRALSAEEFRAHLQAKLREEAAEYQSADSDPAALEELADMLEVILALASVHGADTDQLRTLQEAKRQQRGGFTQAVFLIDVDD